MVIKTNSVLINGIYGWRCIKTTVGNVYLNGIFECYDKMLALLFNGKMLCDEVFKLLRLEYGCFGIIVDHPNFLFASVDRLRSYPVYYSQCNNELIISNSADKLRSHCALQAINHQSLLEFNMTGYVFNRETLYQDLYQLQAGECVFWKKISKKLQIKRYYRYISKPNQTLSSAALEQRLSQCVDRIIQRTIEYAQGAPIWVPLSGGLDSRLILAKLVEFKYDRLHAFSYGVPTNFEAKRARRVAQQLGVRWLFCPFKSERIRDPGYLKARNAYTNFSAGLCVAPNYLGFEAFYALMRNKIIPTDAVMVNGQSGDFITGAHAPRFLYNNETNVQNMMAALIKKHCSLWLNLKTSENLQHITKRITTQLPELDDTISEIDRLYSNYETWEWEERQAKAVVNGQRTYDFFRLKWLLPLWDSEFMDYWETVPYDLKINQKLYIDYLKKYNYNGVFSTLRDDADPWILKYSWIPWAARCIGFLAGKKLKEKYYHYMYYYATDHDQYAYYGREYYLQHYKIARSVASFDAQNYLNAIGVAGIM